VGLPETKNGYRGDAPDPVYGLPPERAPVFARGGIIDGSLDNRNRLMSTTTRSVIAPRLLTCLLPHNFLADSLKILWAGNRDAASHVAQRARYKSLSVPITARVYFAPACHARLSMTVLHLRDYKSYDTHHKRGSQASHALRAPASG
jgi:hypothetical protein